MSFLLINSAQNHAINNFLIFILFLVGLVYFFYRRAVYSDKGNIPWFYAYNDENLLEIYISVAGILVTKDPRDVGQKSQYIFNYFTTKFPDENYDLRRSFIDAYKQPKKIESIAKWLNKKSPTEVHKLNVIQFAISVAAVDGLIIEKEYQLIKQFHLLLKLPLSEFDRLMHIYQQQQDAKHEQEQENTKHRQHSVNYIKERCCKILGLELNATQDEIKSAYRTLAKKHHPDRFMNDSKLQQQLAKERFIEIQKAYEYLSY